MSSATDAVTLPPEADLPLPQCPPEPLWSENYLFALHDPQVGIGMWLHLGTVPTDWHLWEDRIYISLPNGNALSMMSYHATPQADRPGGPVMKFRCLQAFKRWSITFDGFAWETSEAAMVAGGEPRYRKRLRMELEVECVSPAWDARTGKGSDGQSGLAGQAWAREHYEQLVIGRGTFELDGVQHTISATGWRDHSRGPRGRKSKDPWGGHMIAGCVFPSGRSFAVSRYWRPDGVISLEGGMFVDRNGTPSSVNVIATPTLTELVLRGEKLPLHFRWSDGEFDAVMETTSSIWIPRERKHVVGRDLYGELNDMYVLNWGPVHWDGETGHVYLERSAHLNALPAVIR